MKDLLAGLIKTRHCQAKIVHSNIVADFQTTLIRKQTQLLVMIRDNTQVREREKAILTN